MIKIHLYSDFANSRYGFAITDIKTYYPETSTPVNSSAIIDNDKIYGLTDSLTKQGFENRYVNRCEKRTVEYSTDKFGTGTVVTFKNTETGETIDSYEVVLFGDVDGDGQYDGNDAVIVSFLANGMLTKEDVGEAVWMAADCNHDGEINQADVDILIQAGLLLAKVDQTKSAQELSADSVYLEYQSLIDQTPEASTQKAEQNPIISIIKMIVEFVKSIIAIFKNLMSGFAFVK